MRRHLSTLLIAAGLLLMAWPVVTWAYGVYWQDRMARDWAHAAPTAGAPPTAPTVDSPEPEAPPFARLRIERIGLDSIVLEGVNPISLRRGPAHLSDTGMPGESRNCAIASHRDSWFRRLPELEPGDMVEVDTPGCHYEYVVDERQVVEPDRSDLLATGDYPMLTLITCTGPMQPRSLYRMLVFCRLQAVRPTE